MSDKIDNVYGPLTLECSHFGRFTKFFLWFLPTVIHETPDGVIVYKKWKSTMYVLGVMRKPSQGDKARWS